MSTQTGIVDEIRHVSVLTRKYPVTCGCPMFLHNLPYACMYLVSFNDLQAPQDIHQRLGTHSRRFGFYHR